MLAKDICFPKLKDLRLHIMLQHMKSGMDRLNDLL